jgi:aspartate aminotransferase
MFQVIDQVRRLEANGRDVIHFEIGEPDFETPASITQAAVGALRDGDTHYVSSWGLPDFIGACETATEQSRGFRPVRGQTLVTPGANIATYLAMRTLVNPGEEVLIPDPGFPTYLASARAAGVRAAYYQLAADDDFRVHADLIESKVTENTRMIVLNSPSNPTGAVSDPDQIRAVFEIARKYDLYIFSDEIYARMIYGDQDFYSIGAQDACQERVIISNGFSKAFAMTGWRLGVMIGPQQVMEKMMLLLQTTLSCVPPFIQRAGIAALEGKQDYVAMMMAKYEERRNIAVSAINLIPGMTCPNPGGAFYLFPSIKETGLDSTSFTSALLEEQAVAVLPGHNFGPSGEGYIRISYASSEARLREGIDRIRVFCEGI